MPRSILTSGLCLVTISLAGCGDGASFSSTAGAPATSVVSRKSPAGAEADSAPPLRTPAPAQGTPPPSGSTSGQYRSGTLTAGSLDDHAGFEEFSAYLIHVLQHDRRQDLPYFSVGKRAVVEVV